MSIPEPAPFDDEPIAPDRDDYPVRLIHEGGPTTLYYQHHPLDVEGWRGDNFAFTFNIADYNVITSDSVHLPPTVHLFMQATGVYVMNFLPKRAENVPGTERTRGITATSTTTRSRSSTADRSTESRCRPA